MISRRLASPFFLALMILIRHCLGNDFDNSKDSSILPFEDSLHHHQQRFQSACDWQIGTNVKNWNQMDFIERTAEGIRQTCSFYKDQGIYLVKVGFSRGAPAPRQNDDRFNSVSSTLYFVTKPRPTTPYQKGSPPRIFTRNRGYFDEWDDRDFATGPWHDEQGLLAHHVMHRRPLSLQAVRGIDIWHAWSQVSDLMDNSGLTSPNPGGRFKVGELSIRDQGVPAMIRNKVAYTFDHTIPAATRGFFTTQDFQPYVQTRRMLLSARARFPVDGIRPYMSGQGF